MAIDKHYALPNGETFTVKDLYSMRDLLKTIVLKQGLSDLILKLVEQRAQKAGLEERDEVVQITLDSMIKAFDAYTNLLRGNGTAYREAVHNIWTQAEKDYPRSLVI
jgi:hypothetical protein